MKKDKDTEEIRGEEGRGGKQGKDAIRASQPKLAKRNNATEA